MDRVVKHRRFVRKVGMQVPKYVLRALERRHPTVSISWSPQRKQWVLLHHDREGVQLVHMFSGLPNMTNTVRVLDLAHWSNWSNPYAQEKLLRALDRVPGEKRADADRKDQVREGSKHLFNKLTNRKVFQR